MVADGLAAGFSGGFPGESGVVRQWIEPESAFALTRFVVAR